MESLNIYKLKDGEEGYVYTLEPGQSYRNEDGSTITGEAEWMRWAAATPLPGGIYEWAKFVYKMSVDDPSIEQVEATLEVIQSRMSAFGLEGTVITDGGDQIVTKLRDVSDAERVKRLIGKRAQLVFKERTCADPLCQEFTDSDTPLTGDRLVNAFASTDPVDVGWVVNIQFDSGVTNIFSELTERIFTRQDTKRIAIFLDDEELVAPVARAWIRDGQVQITGNFSQEEARTLAIQLESGRLPVALELISEEVCDSGSGCQKGPTN